MRNLIHAVFFEAAYQNYLSDANFVEITGGVKSRTAFLGQHPEYDDGANNWTYGIIFALSCLE